MELVGRDGDGFINGDRWFFAIPQWQGVLSERDGGERVGESFTVGGLWMVGYVFGLVNVRRLFRPAN